MGFPLVLKCSRKAVFHLPSVIRYSSFILSQEAGYTDHGKDPGLPFSREDGSVCQDVGEGRRADNHCARQNSRAEGPTNRPRLLGAYQGCPV